MTVGCSLSMTRGELESLCISDDHPYFIPSKVMDNYTSQVPRWFATNVDTVGIFGNADPLDQNQWVRVRIQSSTYSDNRNVHRTWISSRGECLGLATELNYRIWWTFVGSTDQPQAKIMR
jgi:hypothetical protein